MGAIELPTGPSDMRRSFGTADRQITGPHAGNVDAYHREVRLGSPRWCQIGHSVSRGTEGGQVHPLVRLRRAWWFPCLSRVRSGPRATYVRIELVERPRVDDVEDDLSWLEVEPEKSEWALNGPESVWPLIVRRGGGLGD